MTPEETTVVAGIPIPSTSPIFLTVVGLHVLVGLVCVVAGAIAMLSPKRSGRHPTFGTIYYWGLVAVATCPSGRDHCSRLLALACFPRARRWRPLGHCVGLSHPPADRLLRRQPLWAFRRLRTGYCPPRPGCRSSSMPCFILMRH